jgi:hypothetical protein
MQGTSGNFEEQDGTHALVLPAVLLALAGNCPLPQPLPIADFRLPIGACRWQRHWQRATFQRTETGKRKVRAGRAAGDGR